MEIAQACRLNKRQPGWWKSAVVYQIYPKSFQDSDGDGLGDLPGILSRLDYLETLGVDGIWLCPVFDSPQVDNGYDISDYRDIWPPYGTLDDMKTLIREAGKRGISVILDLVMNHSSDRHPWFLEARKSRDNPYHDWYVWADGTPDCPPSDLRAAFGGSAWTWVPEVEQFYFHAFAPQQPDLNWTSSALRQELYAMIRFWIDLGVEGFRLDVLDMFGKDPLRGITKNGPMLHERVAEMSRNAFREPWLMTVGETWDADLDHARAYSSPDRRELSMVFQFEHICLDRRDANSRMGTRPFSVRALKECMERWQHGMYGQGWNSLFWDNHDLPRIVSRWGDDREYRTQSAKMLATLLYGMQGTVFLYQGEELGMTNCPLSLAEYNDVGAHGDYRRMREEGWTDEEALQWLHAWSRDNARTPMQWTDGPQAGFTSGTPWLPVNPNYREINAAAAMADPESVFHHYRKLIALRKQYPVFRDGTFTLLDRESEQLFSYTRDTEQESLLVVCNFSAQIIPWSRPAGYEDAELLLSVYGEPGPQLRPYEALLFHLMKEPC